MVKQGQLSTPADIPVAIFNPYNSVHFKITNFSFLFTFFATIITFGELTSTTSNERMTTDIIFVGATPIN